MAVGSLTTWSTTRPELPGHFHITVGTASAMTFMGVAFWMMPHLTGRQLLSRRLALASVWLWFGGMSVFALGMHWSGLYGVPRRAWVSFLPQSVYDRVYGDAHLPLTLVAIGGVVLWLATIAFYIVFLGSLLTRRLPKTESIPFAQAFGGRESYSIDDGETAGIVSCHARSSLASVLEHLGVLTAITAAATAAAYIPIFWPFLHNVTQATGWKVW